MEPHLTHEELMPAPTPEERAANWRNINRLHPANRFRIMFNQPLLKEDGSGVMTLQEQEEHMRPHYFGED